LVTKATVDTLDGLIRGEDGDLTPDNNGDLAADTELFAMGDLVEVRDFFKDGVVGVLGIDFSGDFGVTGDCNPSTSITFIFNLSGGGLVTDFVTPLVAEKVVFTDSALTSTTGLIADLEDELLEETVTFFTEVTTLVFSEALLAGGALAEDSDTIFLTDVFKGDAGDLGDPGDEALDPDPVLEIVISPDFFNVDGNVIMCCKKNINVK